MNKMISVARLCKDPEVRYGGANNTCIANFPVAINRDYKREGDPDADFFHCTAFGKTAEFIEKYLHKGTKVILEGKMQNNNYQKDGQMVYSTSYVIEKVEFAENKNANQQVPQQNYQQAPQQAPQQNYQQEFGFMNIPDGIEEELPFN